MPGSRCRVSIDETVRELQNGDAVESWRLGAWRTPLMAHQYEWMTETITRYAPVGASVLDWGSGDGYFSYWLTRNGYNVTALDLREPTLVPTVGPGSFTFVPAPDPKNLPFDLGSFDIVTSMGVLEHVRETSGSDVYSLSEIRRVLQPGGYFICAHLPNYWSAPEWAVRRFASVKYTHAFRYKAQNIDPLMGGVGFDVIERARYGVLPRNETKRLPRYLSDSPVFARAFDGADRALAIALRPLVQNFAFVARHQQRDLPASDRHFVPMGS